MFAKLLKHEIKATGGMLGILSPIVLVVSLLGGFVMRSVMNFSDTAQSMEGASLLAGLLLPFVFLSLFAYAFGSEIYLVVQFYKRKFTDQGYLTFTLPVPTWQIYLSSLLNLMLWSLVIGFVTIFSIVLIMFIAIYETDAWHMMMEYGFEFPREFEAFYAEFDVWLVANTVISFVSSNVLMITSITLGSVLAKKHKILASIGCYYLISLVINLVSTMISANYIYDAVDPSLDIMYMTSAGLYAAASLLGSAVTIWLMNKKLNLP